MKSIMYQVMSHLVRNNVEYAYQIVENYKAMGMLLESDVELLENMIATYDYSEV